jgi:hypothetical protein
MKSQIFLPPMCSTILSDKYDQPQFPAMRRNLYGTQLTPFVKSTCAVELEVFSTVKVTFLAELVLDARMFRCELLQTRHAPEWHRLTLIDWSV